MGSEVGDGNTAVAVGGVVGVAAGFVAVGTAVGGAVVGEGLSVGAFGEGAAVSGVVVGAGAPLLVPHAARLVAARAPRKMARSWRLDRNGLLIGIEIQASRTPSP
jgi:hypothetical protein